MSYYDHATMMKLKLGHWAEESEKDQLEKQMQIKRSVSFELVTPLNNFLKAQICKLKAMARKTSYTSSPSRS
ncbi:MAG: hypothetical protein AAF217_01805 [Pseudomonadota bacterium]